MPAESKDKFVDDDLPKILTALHAAHEGKQTARVTIEFDPNGGVVAIQVESKKRFK